MKKSNGCFKCLNHSENNGQLKDDGWYHPCKIGIPNEGLHKIEECSNYEPNKGFQRVLFAYALRKR
jgi:hypothetical protein